MTADPDFLALLAHELRGPLAPLRTSLELLKRPNVPEQTKERARVIMERQVVQMAHLIDELTDIARIGRGQLELRPERCALKDMVDAAAEAVAPTLGEREQALLLDLPASPLWLHADRSRLVQILGCLLGHVSRSLERGQPVRLRAHVDGGGLTITLGDGSSGTSSATAKPLHGIAGPRLDLDLLLAQRLLALHGGTLQTRDAGAGEGGLVVRLPRERVAGETA